MSAASPSSPIRVTHSIADGIGLAIETAVGTIVHTGDFKLDPHPVDGQQRGLRDVRRARASAACSALCSDSTNVGRPGHTGSETEVGRAPSTGGSPRRPGRIIVATFASHIHRIQQLLDLAVRYGRRVALLGRSMDGQCRASPRSWATSGWPRGSSSRSTSSASCPPRAR